MEKKKFISYIQYLIYKIAMIIILSFFILNYVIGIKSIKGVDMYPHIKDGDLIVYNRLSSDYSVGDAVLYDCSNQLRCGRITAMENDIVDIDDSGKLKINNHIQHENMIYPTYSSKSGVVFPYKVKVNSYFILSDLRTEIQDSREYGCIHKDNMRGRIILIIRIRGF